MKKKHLREIKNSVATIQWQLNELLNQKAIVLSEDEFFSLIRISGSIGKKEPLTGKEIAESLEQWKMAMQNKNHKL